MFTQVTMHKAREIAEGLVDGIDLDVGGKVHERLHHPAGHVAVELEGLHLEDRLADTLHKAGFSVSYARRDTKLIGKDWKDKTPWPVSIAYLAVCPKGSEPKVICAPRQVRF
jgi:hypothetical protein